MKLTNPEKLTLLMLSEIYDKLGLQETNTALIREAIYSDNTWALTWEMPGVVGNSPDPTPPLVSEVVNYLDMWSFLEGAYKRFDGPTQDKIKSEFRGAPLRFEGFDSNNEGELLGIARILVEHMNRYTHFSGRVNDTHMPVREIYARMYQAFEPMRKGLMHGGLSPEQVLEVLQARRFPGN